MTVIPIGFRLARIGGDFLMHNGPLYGKWTPDKVQLGFVVEQRHTNPLGICHGGMLATFADMMLPMLASRKPSGILCVVFMKSVATRWWRTY